MRCAYASDRKVRCSGPTLVTVHDLRGCKDVCFAHARWRMERCSFAFNVGVDVPRCACKGGKS